MGTLIRRAPTRQSAAWSIRTWWAGHGTYVTYCRYRHPLNVIDEATEIVIEAFPRSANTFATVAFQLSQPAPVRVAHHLHAPAQVVEAVRRGIPALVPVRRPRDAVVSQVIRSPGLTLASVLAGYVRFHERLLPVKTGCHVATFEQVTGDFGAVIDALNSRFGTDFGTFPHSPESVAEVYRMIDERARLPQLARAAAAYRSGIISRSDLESLAAGQTGAAASAPVPELRVARPAEQRSQLQAALRAEYAAPHLTALRRKAEATYERMLSDAQADVKPRSGTAQGFS
jgi:hypothetical protein